MINKNYNKNIKKERLEMALFIASECGEDYVFENEKELGNIKSFEELDSFVVKDNNFMCVNDMDLCFSFLNLEDEEFNCTTFYTVALESAWKCLKEMNYLTD